MARFKYVNNELIEITETELAELEAKELEFNNNLFNRALEEVRLKRNNLLAKTDWKNEIMTSMHKAVTDGKAYVG